jgi:hypothetical protein
MENSFVPIQDDSHKFLPFDSAALRGRFDTSDMTPQTIREIYYYSGGPTGKPHGVEYTITESPRGNYRSIHSGDENPAFHLLRGHTYYFKVHAKGHPFWISRESSHPPKPFDRVINNGTDDGVIEFTVPMDISGNLYYMCSNHSNMTGVIYITDVGATGPTGPPSSPLCKTYLHTYNQRAQVVMDGSSIIFDKNGLCSGACHTENSPSIYVYNTGVFNISTQIYSVNGCQFSIFKNDNAISGSTIGTLTGSTLNTLTALCEVCDDDLVSYPDLSDNACKFELVNTTGYGSALLYDASSVGYSVPLSNSSFLLCQI